MPIHIGYLVMLNFMFKNKNNIYFGLIRDELKKIQAEYLYRDNKYLPALL